MAHMPHAAPSGCLRIGLVSKWCWWWPMVQSARATLINSAQTHTSIWIMKRGPRPPTWKWKWTWTRTQTWTWTWLKAQQGKGWSSCRGQAAAVGGINLSTPSRLLHARAHSLSSMGFVPLAAAWQKAKPTAKTTATTTAKAICNS